MNTAGTIVLAAIAVGLAGIANGLHAIAAAIRKAHARDPH
jgi:F0F1-type ATP synthase membrane subunit c/vacuolar-type H+-ATPase subunit K